MLTISDPEFENPWANQLVNKLSPYHVPGAGIRHKTQGPCRCPRSQSSRSSRPFPL